MVVFCTRRRMGVNDPDCADIIDRVDVEVDEGDDEAAHVPGTRLHG